ncbi:ABC transporter ATP-binding protein [Cutibacterium sp. WCA-380-WT-3A]|uniref:Fatty acid ABC transporter ATP-binding/permease protein n=1 Tax=Cutibacterium porci TaxID=2605781 RepID=A0A7K0J4G1_9ACTN|nr:ABC transporter ATP-binding protein [Cutibacterium porci]MSS44825.1 ABC transporter ATP-binding protein [Cutibacterium porci]
MTGKDSAGAPTRSKHAEIARASSRHGAARVAEKPISFGPSLKRLLGQLKPHRITLTVVVIMAAVSVAFNVIGPKILGRATDVIFGGIIGRQIGKYVPEAHGMTAGEFISSLGQAGHGGDRGKIVTLLQQYPDVIIGAGVDFHRLGIIMGWALALYACAALLMFMQGFLLNTAIQRSMYDLRRRVSAKLEKLPLSYFDGQPHGELMSRMTNDIDNVSQTLLQTLQQLLNAVLTVIGVLTMMFWISPLLAVISLIVIPIAGVVAGLIGKRAQGQFARMWKATGELNSQVEEAYSGHALVKTFGRSQAVAHEFHDRNEELRRATAKAQFVSGLIQPVMFLLGNANYAIIVLIGCLRVAKGQMPLGNVQAFIQYSRMFTQPITQIASMANLLQSGVASAERVFQVLDADELSTDATGTLPATQGRVVFDHVHFSYSPDKPLITDLSLVAEPGQTVAIVGPTGAGKTTLVNLLMRFYEIDGGAITLDGVDISTVPRTELRSRLGMVLQDTWLFGGSIHDNIAYGRPEASETDILDAARAAHVDHFVHTLPEGYDTVIDEDGSNVSAGQKQLITIARAFLAAPDLLILDEATSSVDTRTEMLVQEAMANLRDGRTSFVIAHRLSTIRDADLILVMEHGDIVEQGSHSQLLERKGHYYELYQTQFNAA